MRDRMKKIFAHTLSFLIIFSFVFSYGFPLAQAWVPGEPLVPCENDCDFNDLIQGINNIVQFLLYAAAFVAALLFAWAGFLYVSAAGDPGKVKSAHKIFTTAGIGLVLMASAWLIIKVIVDTLGSDAGSMFLEDISMINHI